MEFRPLPRPTVRQRETLVPKSMPPCVRPSDCRPIVCGGQSGPWPSRCFDILIRNKEFAEPTSVNGMKRDVCVDEPDRVVPAKRHRSADGHASAVSPRKTGAACYQIGSISTNASPRPHPRAYAAAHGLSRSSPAIPPHVNASVRHPWPVKGMQVVKSVSAASWPRDGFHDEKE